MAPIACQAGTTTVTVRCTGHVRTEIGTSSFEFTFRGERLRAFLAELFEEHPRLESMLIAETEDEATHHGWTNYEGTPPGSWAKNSEGEQTAAFVRVLVNGRFNEHLEGLDTELDDGDRVSLMYPFIFCC